MGFQSMEAAMSVDGLTTTDKMVLLALSNFKNEQTGECFPSIQTIALSIGASGKTVKRSLKRLESYGVLHRTKKTINHGFVWSWDIDYTVDKEIKKNNLTGKNDPGQNDPCQIDPGQSVHLTRVNLTPKQGSMNDISNACARGKVMNSPFTTAKPINYNTFDTPTGTIVTRDTYGNPVEDNLDPKFTGNVWPVGADYVPSLANFAMRIYETKDDVPEYDFEFTPTVRDFIVRYMAYKGYAYDERYVKIVQQAYEYILRQPNYVRKGHKEPTLNWKHFIADQVDITASGVADDGERYWFDNRDLL